MLRDNASHIWIGAGSPRARCFSTSAMFSPACFHPVKNSAMVHAPTIDTMPLVKVPVRLSPGSRVSRRIRMPVSSLCITLPCAACRINSSSTGRISFAAAAISSHCVAAGSGIPSCSLQPFQPLEWHSGTVLQQGDHRHGRLIVLVRTRRSGSSAVKTSPQALQRSRSISNTVASSGACPTNLTSVAGSFWRYTFPRRHSGHWSPEWSVACATATLFAPVNAAAPLRP